MLSKKVYIPLLISLYVITINPLFAYSGVDFERKSFVYSSEMIELKERPGFLKNTLTFIDSSGIAEVVGKEVTFDGTSWIKIRFANYEGWVDSSQLVREEYYSMQDSLKTIFVREKMYLGSTTQDLCVTGDSTSLSSMVTDFRAGKQEYIYTPSETIRTNTDTSTQIVNTATTTDFRAQVPLFKYVVNESVKPVEETPILSTITGFVTTSFRKVAGIFSYTPLEVVRDTVDGVVVSDNTTTITDFRGGARQYEYTPLEVVRDTVDGVVVSDNTTTITDFRGGARQYVYTPAEFTPSYSCIQTK